MFSLQTDHHIQGFLRDFNQILSSRQGFPLQLHQLNLLTAAQKLLANGEFGCALEREFSQRLIASLARAGLTNEQKDLIRFFYAFCKIETFILYECDSDSSELNSNTSHVAKTIQSLFTANLLPVMKQNFLKIHWLFNRRLSRQRIRYEQLPHDSAIGSPISHALRPIGDIDRIFQAGKNKFQGAARKRELFYRADISQEREVVVRDIFLYVQKRDSESYRALIANMHCFYVFPWMVAVGNSVTTEFVSLLKKLYFSMLQQMLFNGLELYHSIGAEQTVIDVRLGRVLPVYDEPEIVEAHMLPAQVLFAAAPPQGLPQDMPPAYPQPPAYHGVAQQGGLTQTHSIVLPGYGDLYNV